MLELLLSSLHMSVLVYLALGLLTIWFLKSWLNRPKNLPPCPVRPYPLLGHIPMMKKEPRETMLKWRKETGDIFSLYLGTQLTIVISSYELLKETLVKQAHIFSDRPRFFANALKDGEKGIIGSSGENWKEQRTVSLSILRHFGMGKNYLAEKIEEETGFYLNELASFGGQPRDVKMLTNTSVSNNICSIIVGKRFDYHDPLFLHFMQVISEQIKLAATTSPSLMFKWLKYLPGNFLGAQKFQKNSEELRNNFSHAFVQKALDKKDSDEEENFITAYLKELDRKIRTSEATTMDMANLQRIIDGLFVAGTETTSTTIIWFMLYMLHYPHIQKKVYDEINDEIGTERPPSIQDRPKLNYLNATIMETQRLASIVPLSLIHVCNSEVTVKGYTIPAGTSIVPHLDAVLLNEKTWGDPLNFRPERFLDNKGNLLCPEEFVPFSLGRRECLGESLAKMELFLYLSHLVQRFELQPAVAGQLPPCKYVFGITTSPQPYKLRFIERKT